MSEMPALAKSALAVLATLLVGLVVAGTMLLAAPMAAYAGPPMDGYGGNSTGALNPAADPADEWDPDLDHED